MMQALSSVISSLKRTLWILSHVSAVRGLPIIGGVYASYGSIFVTEVVKVIPFTAGRLAYKKMYLRGTKFTWRKSVVKAVVSSPRFRVYIEHCRSDDGTTIKQVFCETYEEVYEACTSLEEGLFPHVSIRSAHDGSKIGTFQYALFYLRNDLVAARTVEGDSTKHASIAIYAPKGRVAGWACTSPIYVVFKEGDMIFDPSYGDSDTDFRYHGTRPIRNLNDAKISAENLSKYLRN